jgi:multiple sugar transport system ATP-binding protein
MTNHPMLSVQNLQKSFGALDILKDISFEIFPGDFLVLVGPSGCGKSTLLGCIAGLEEVTSGQIWIDGRDVTRENPARRDLSMVFQSYALFPNMSVAENIAFGLDVRGVAKDVQTQKTAEVADILKIGALLNRKPANLSGGQRQRVAMGRALVRDPKIFLFDEPLSNLDAKLRVSMRTEIKRLHQKLGATMVYVTHDQIEAMTLATRILVMKDGEVQQAGTPADIYLRPANTFVAGFMGAPPMNLVPADIRAEGSALRIEVARRDDSPIVLFHRAPPAALLGGGTRRVLFGLRPEAFGIQQDPTRQATQAIEVEIDVVENAGSDIYATLTLGGADTVARLPADANVATGQRSVLYADLSRASFFDPETGIRL